MTAHLPLKVLGLVGPVLSWVEGAEGLRFPQPWLANRLSATEREKAWLVRELPTYSQDTVEEVIRSARWADRDRRPEPLLPRLLRGEHGSRVAPPPDYSLASVFWQLGRRYFEWRGTELTIRSQRMEELHELALRFPVAHLIRHFHAQAVSRGFLSEKRAQELPEQLALIQTSSHGLRSVVSRGLAEGHLHLWGVLGGSDTWPDHLLNPLTPGILRGYEIEEERLFLLCRAALRILAFAALQVRLHPEAQPPFHLLNHLDALYLASGDMEERLGRRRLRDHLHRATLPTRREEAASSLRRAMEEGGFDPRELRRRIGRGSFRARLRRITLEQPTERLTDLLHSVEPLAEGSGAVVGSPPPRRRLLRELEERLAADPIPFLLWAMDGGDLGMEDLENQVGLSWLHRSLREGDRAGLKHNAAAVLPRALASRDPEILRLLRLAHPLVERLRHHQKTTRGEAREGIRQRLRLIGGLHLTVHKLLLEDPGRRDPEDRPRPTDRSRQAASHEFLHQAFFRYLVYQTHHWQLATQSGRTTGLRYFKRHMEASQRHTLDPDTVETQGLILERLRHAGHLRTVEGRISPPDSTEDLVPWVLGYAEGADNKELEGFGLVVHFIKGEKREVEDHKLPDTRRRMRHGRVRRRVQRQAEELFLLLSNSHPAVPFIVGIDAANLELTTPPEVFAPAFRFLRDYPIEPRPPSSPWERFGAHAEVASLLSERRLGLTYHVGEDFRHLVSGLRAIAEVLTFLKPRPGDRLGHAIALALEPEVWMKQNGYQAVVSKQEALDDLVWLLHFLGPGNDTVGELELEDRIQQLSRELYGAAALPDDEWLQDMEQRIERMERTGDEASEVTPERRPRLQWDWSPLTLHHAWQLRQLDPYLIDFPAAFRGRPGLIDAPANSPVARRWIHVQRRVLEKLRTRGAGTRSAFHLLSLYWLHHRVREKGEELVNLDMHRQRHLWIRLCRELQEKLRREVDRRQLIVEVNPSSNRLVGPMEKIGEHHIFAMSLDEEGKLDRRLRVTVNTDDPGVFNTSLPHEYYLLGEILLERGVSEPRVEEWLEWLRQNGEDASFTRCLPRADDPRVQRILTNLKRSREAVSERFGGGDLLPGFWKRLRRGHRELSEVAAVRRANWSDGRWRHGCERCRRRR